MAIFPLVLQIYRDEASTLTVVCYEFECVLD